jgi:hypothetical protein
VNLESSGKPTNHCTTEMVTQLIVREDCVKYNNQLMDMLVFVLNVYDMFFIYLLRLCDMFYRVS